MAVGDFNADGHPDPAVANFYSGNASVLLGTGRGSFGALTSFAVGALPYSLTVGDFNHDGALDLATASGGANSLLATVNQGSCPIR